MATHGDPSHNLDLVTVYESADTESEFEAANIKALLESEEIPAFLIGDSRFPNLPFEVRVPRDMEAKALHVIESALAAGPAGAEEAEEAGEQS